MSRQRNIKPIVHYDILPFDQAAKLASSHAKGSNLDHPTRWQIIALLLNADQHLMASMDILNAIAAYDDGSIATIGHHLRGLAKVGLISNKKVERSSLYWLDTEQAQRYSQLIQEVSNANS